MNKLLIALSLLALANAAYVTKDLLSPESRYVDYAAIDQEGGDEDLVDEDLVEYVEEEDEELQEVDGPFSAAEAEELGAQSVAKFGFGWDKLCKQCHPGCFPWMRGNKKCDAVCNFPKCKYDDGDCKPTPGAKYCYFDKKHPFKSCLWSKIGNGKCDWECFRPECNYDGGDCYDQDCDYKTFDKKTHCAPGCLWRMVGNDICDWQCLTKHCYFDYKDCCPDGKCDHHGH